MVRGHPPPDGSVASPAHLRSVPLGIGPTYLLRDNDRAYGHVFTSRVTAMGIRDRPISPGSPWQNGIAERLIGTLRRECLNHMVIFGEAPCGEFFPPMPGTTIRRVRIWP